MLRLNRDQILLTSLVLCVLNTILFLLPGVILAGHPSIAMKLTAILWIMAVQIYVTNQWSRIPVFLNAMLMPSLVLMVWAFYRLTATFPTPATVGQTGIAVVFVIVFCLGVFRTLRQHSRTEAHLLQARQEAQARLADLEQSQRLDPLTGLLNRIAFDKALFVLLKDRVFGDGEVAVFLVDLDSFKPINDTYTHEAGDTVLRCAADRLRTQIGERGFVGRLGGDEFICALPNVADPQEAAMHARRISSTLAEPVSWKDRKLKISASIGYALTVEEDGRAPATVSELCSAADQAMFAAKSAPNGEPVCYQAHLFAPRMTARDKQLLSDGLARGAIRPFYQPKVKLRTGQITGFEALARWDHPTRGICPPSDFIDQINEMGLQGDFMTSLAYQVVADIRTMLAAGLDPGQVSLNLSEVALATYTGRQDLHRIVACNPDAAKHLTFEITEDVFIARAADTIQASVTSFRDLGVRISLDDFGTGFASFHHLRQLDFDELKIDTTFVEGLGTDATSEVLVNGFLNIASGLGVGVVAEGVETEAQSRDLQNMGCIVGQGYLFSPAVPLDEAMAQLSSQQAA